MRFVWIGVKNPLHTDRCRHGSVYHNNELWQLEINRRLIFWGGNPSQWNRPRSDLLKVKLPWLLLLKRLHRRLLRSPDIFWNHTSWSQKEEISRSTTSTSISAPDSSLLVEVSESRPFSSNFVRLGLVVVCPSASLEGLASSNSFNHSSWLHCGQCDSPGGGAQPYMGYIGMCRFEGYGFQAVYFGIGYINQSVWI